MSKLLFAVRACVAAPTLSLISLVACQNVHAHGFVGDRFFPATISIDDPFVADELSLPTVSAFKNGDNVREADVSFEFSKRITEHFGVSVGQTWTHLKPGATGFQNLETAFKYQLFTDAKSEFVLSAGLELEWANTGAKGAGAENFNSYSPQIFFGKGFGDLPEEVNLLRPFAITGQAAYAIPGRGKTVNFTNAWDTDREIELNPRNLNWGFTLQYSLPYLNSHVQAIEGPGAEFLRRLIPLVEGSFTTPASNLSGHQVTTGTINPGVIWSGQWTQFGVEAMIPVNRESGRGVGVIAQAHFYLDDIFPSTIGKPLF
jgi:hypothetical protein